MAAASEPEAPTTPVIGICVAEGPCAVGVGHVASPTRRSSQVIELPCPGRQRAAAGCAGHVHPGSRARSANARRYPRPALVGHGRPESVHRVIECMDRECYERGQSGATIRRCRHAATAGMRCAAARLWSRDCGKHDSTKRGPDYAETGTTIPCQTVRRIGWVAVTTGKPATSGR